MSRQRLKHCIEITPRATPRPQVKRLKNGRTQVYYPHNYHKYKTALGLLLKTLRIKQPVNGEWLGWLRVEFYLPCPKKAKKSEVWEGRTHRKKPDVDNYIKGLMDGLESAGVIKNDSNFYHIDAAKYYTLEKPRIEFDIM